MNRARWWRSLRVQLALLGCAAIYLPVLLLFGVTEVTEMETTSRADGLEVTRASTTHRSPWVVATVVGLGPVAAAVAWWWAGRAVRPIARVRLVAEEIEGTDLGRRIGLDRGPREVVALAASFDAMLDRLEAAAATQHRLIEETSHELRTPLAVLTTNAEVVLAQPGAGADDLRRGLVRSRTAAARLQATIDQLLAEARGRARTIARRPTDLVAVARSVVAEVGPLAGPRGIAVSVVAPDTLTCRLDQPTVRRAVLNLVDNAVRHAPDGTTVAVAVAVALAPDPDPDPADRADSADPADPADSAVRRDPADSAVRRDPAGSGRPHPHSHPHPVRWVRVTVTDHGPGVPAEEQERIFERFWRAGPHDPERPGAGLGLPIARQVAEAHGGTLTVRSPLPTGPGAAFTLSFPHHDD